MRNETQGSRAKMTDGCKVDSLDIAKGASAWDNDAVVSSLEKVTMERTKPIANPQLMLGIAFSCFIIIGASPGILNIAWKYMQETFTVSADSLGVLLAAGTLGGLGMAFASGYVISQYGLGRYMLVGSLIGAGGALGIAVAPSFGMLLVVAFFLSLGNATIDSGMNNFVSAYFGRGPMNWLHAFFGVGSTIGPIIATFFIVTVDSSWRASYLVVMVMLLAGAAAIFLTVAHWRMPQASTSLDQTDHYAEPSASPLESIRTPGVLVGMLLFAVFGGVEIGTGQLANTLFVDGRNITQEVSSFWISFYWGSFTVARMVVGSMGERISNTTLMRMATFGAALGALLLWWNPVNGVGFLGLGIIGVSAAPMFATWVAETPRRVGRRHFANSIGFQLGAAGAGGAVLPGIAGLLVKSSGPEVIGPFLLACTIALVMVHEAMLWTEARQPVAEKA